MFREGIDENCLAMSNQELESTAYGKCADLTVCLGLTLPGQQFHKHLENEVSIKDSDKWADGHP